MLVIVMRVSWISCSAKEVDYVKVDDDDDDDDNERDRDESPPFFFAFLLLVCTRV